MITGSIVALVTPMTPAGAVDYPALSRLVEWHITQGTNAIVAVGTTGESATLEVEEHIEVIRQVVAVAAGRIPIIAGTGANSTTEAIAWSAAARTAGVDACLLVTPYYNKPSQRGLYQHHKAIAEAVDIPQILYNVPGRTACDMLPDTIAKLAELPNIVGVKEATGNLERGRQVLQLVPTDFAVYSGDDATALELILLGAKGNISVTANVIPHRMSEICLLGLAGKADAARELNARIAALHKDLFLESNPVPVKWALKEMGLIQSGIRLPLVELDPLYHEPLRRTLHACAVL
ncbi:MAG: 4-hydroxy-tetrahydrodipicolinate synthase [Pseudomonadales bacterium]|jgi:4-hydroxy-tetrahydrodipicolinate synthase|nr:4-hydroxy-tetrahydrodipicolinate synthase [Pseudomonadales bacterium]